MILQVGDELYGSQYDFAAYCRVTYATVKSWYNKGWVVLHQFDGTAKRPLCNFHASIRKNPKLAGMPDSAFNQEWLKVAQVGKKTKPIKSHVEEHNKQSPYVQQVMSQKEAQVKQAIADANLAELEYKIAIAEVVEAAEVENKLAKAFAAMKEAMLQIPSRLAPVVAAESKEDIIYHAMRSEILSALRTLRGVVNEALEED